MGWAVWRRWARAIRVTPWPARLAAMAVGCCAALVLAACGPFATAHPGPYYPAIGAATSPTPTVAPLGYTVAAWPANSAPFAGAPVEIIVAFRNAGAPVAGATVALAVQPAGSYAAQSYGPLNTNAAGYAGITVSGAGEQPNYPMLVQVTVTYQGQTYSTSTVFTPAP